MRWLPQALRRRQEQESASGDGTKSRAVSYKAWFSKYVRQLDAAQASEAELVASVSKVLDFVQDNGVVSYYLPEILTDVGPEGLVVPTAVAARADSTTDAEGLRRLARIGGAYALNGSPWRTMALAAIRAARPVSEDALLSVYSSLGDGGIRSWSGAVGEVPLIFIAAVAEARAALDAEGQAEPRPYWTQSLAVAEDELREQEERAKEERGE